MAKYIVKRVAMGIFSVFIVATLTFFIMNLVPGGPFVAEKSISKAAQQALAEKYGLDKPLGVQYLNYMNSLIHGDMGLSLKQRGRTVNQIIFSKLPVSARTAGLAVVVALCVGIPLGCLSAYNRGKWADNLIIVFATCGIAIPSFISSVVLLYTFGMNLKLLPTVGLNEPAAYIMPVTALGASGGRIIKKHLLTNCMGTLIVTTTLQIPSSIFTESYLSFLGLGVAAPMPSLGSLATDAVKGMNTYPVLLIAPALMISIMILVFNLFGDGLRDAFDPKLKS